MRRKQQIQALQQELALLRQTVDSGKELAALAADAAGQLRKPSLRTVAVQVMKTPRVRRAVLIAGGTVAAAALGAAAVLYLLALFKGHKLGKFAGVFMILCYAGYFVYLFTA